MISLLLSVLRARPAQAITVFLLSMVATAAAVAAPVALRTVDAAVVRNEVAQARTMERSISLVGFVNPSDRQTTGPLDSLFSLMLLPGFELIRGGELDAFTPVPQGSPIGYAATTRVAFRDRLCEHLVIVNGRCFGSPLEIVIGETMAKRSGLAPGDVATLQSARYDPASSSMQPDGEPIDLTVVGTYRPRDPGEFYWAAQSYFPVRPDGTLTEPVFLTAQTYDLVQHTVGSVVADALAPTGALTVDRFDTLGDEVARLTDPDSELPPNVTIVSEIEALAERVERGRSAAAQLVPVAFVPLVALCWFVVFLAVSYGLVGRRPELALVTLRGTTRGRRWWLAVAEPLVAILAGAPVGYLLGHAVVRLVAVAGLGGTEGSEVSASALPFAAVAVAGAVAVALLGQRRTLAEPVVNLLRGVPARVPPWRALVAELLLVGLAVAGVILLRADATTSSAALSGVALVVPGLVVVALALVAARLFTPMAGGIARQALRRGRLGSGLAAVQIARRPGSQQVFALLAVALGLLTFVAAGSGVAAQGRADRAGILVGAPIVLTAEQASVNQLLHATRRADPEGLWAMAVQPVPQEDPAAAPVLAIDTGRLPSVAAWRTEYGVEPSAVAGLLAPPPADPLVLSGPDYEVEVTRDNAEESPPLQLTLSFEAHANGAEVSSTVDIVHGRHTYPGRVLGCEQGCRFTGLAISGVRNDSVFVSLHALRGLNPAQDVFTTADLNNRQRWSGSPGTVVVPFNAALRIETESSPFAEARAEVSVVDAPTPVPVLSTRATAAAINSLGPVRLDTRLVTHVTLLPRLGADGIVVDLEYLQRLDQSRAAKQAGEVWLGPAAPPDAVERLRTAGLSVRETASIARSQSDLDNAGPALALRFHLAAAGFGIALALGGLGLVASVDRRRRAEDLRALRLQGLPPRFVRRSAVWGYLWLVGGSALAGLLAGAAAWYATGERLPVFTDTLAQLPPPRWPELSVVLVPWSVATATLVVAAVASAQVLRATVRRAVRNTGKKE